LLLLSRFVLTHAHIKYRIEVQPVDFILFNANIEVIVSWSLLQFMEQDSV